MKAFVSYTSPIDGHEVIDVNGHRIQCGGEGDGYCYGHQSFDCMDNLSVEERRAISEV